MDYNASGPGTYLPPGYQPVYSPSYGYPPVQAEAVRPPPATYFSPVPVEGAKPYTIPSVMQYAPEGVFLRMGKELQKTLKEINDLVGGILFHHYSSNESRENEHVNRFQDIRLPEISFFKNAWIWTGNKTETNITMTDGKSETEKKEKRKDPDVSTRALAFIVFAGIAAAVGYFLGKDVNKLIAANNGLGKVRKLDEDFANAGISKENIGTAHDQETQDIYDLKRHAATYFKEVYNDALAGVIIKTLLVADCVFGLVAAVFAPELLAFAAVGGALLGIAWMIKWGVSTDHSKRMHDLSLRHILNNPVFISHHYLSKA